MKGRYISALLFLLSFTACSTPTEQAKQNCREYGFQPGTQAFAECMQKERLARKQRGMQQMQTGLEMMQ